jgi:CO dehydrogenase/acetyl-CoA synthase gamma subunit (corrinoid Fe-S protein)
MALTGIQIFKLLPKTNCKECGVPTCLAFAMNLASGKAELDACPYVSDDARAQLAEASAPPIRPVVVGKGVRKATAGGETVQYRHEKPFSTPPCWPPRYRRTFPPTLWPPSSKGGMRCSSSGWASTCVPSWWP